MSGIEEARRLANLSDDEFNKQFLDFIQGLPKKSEPDLEEADKEWPDDCSDCMQHAAFDCRDCFKNNPKPLKHKSEAGQ